MRLVLHLVSRGLCVWMVTGDWMMPAVGHLRITNRMGFHSGLRCVSTVDVDDNFRFPQETGVCEAV